MQSDGNARLNEISEQVIGAAIEVHKQLGPGLLESVYEVCMGQELALRGIKYQSQVSVPIIYKGTRLEADYRADLIVESQVVVELKAIEKLLAVHEAQLLSYLKLTSRRLGLLINFNVPVLKQGIRRLILLGFLCAFVSLWLITN